VDSGFSFEVINGMPVVTAPREIDVTNSPQLRAAFLQTARYAHKTVVADLTHTEFCDSAGLHTLLAAHKRACSEGGELLVVANRPAVRRVFALTAADQLMRTFTSMEEAFRHHLAGRDYLEPPEYDPAAAR
jgi:anti-sigma B factor antagonist